MMNLRQKGLRFLNEPAQLEKLAGTGVSLHCHTKYSKEMLDFIPYYAERIPLVKHFWKIECKRYLKKTGKLPNFTTGYWEPPLTGAQVFKSEQSQMNDLGLDAIVSITDHDCMDANIELNETLPNAIAPISMEWTVPFDYAFFHVGVHNLPPERAADIRDLLLDYSFNKEIQNNDTLHELFAMLNEVPEVLIVLNHPVWDIEMIGEELHMKLLHRFIAEHGSWLHALEINGFRSWSENEAVIELAAAHDFVLVSGGDRHCLTQNTIINTTSSTTFAEFVEEIRVSKHSEMVIMPGYHLPLEFRQVRSMSQIMANYPEFEDGRNDWINRVLIDLEDGEGLQVLSHHWKSGRPAWSRVLMRALTLLSNERLCPFYALHTKRSDRVPRTRDSLRPASPMGRKPVVIDI